MTEIQKDLFSLADADYKAFHSKLIPNISPDKIIGVRTPVLRKYAAAFFKSEKYEDFLKTLPHKYYEENNLHGMMIEKTKDCGTAIGLLDDFLPYIDNWATCDLISPKSFDRSPEKVTAAVKRWIKSDKTYEVRFAVVILMKYFLDENFSPEYAEAVAEIRSDEYYINMARAWYFATALAKRRAEILPYFEEKRLDTRTHNKAIRKAVESYRISPEDKEYLRKLTVK